MFKVFISFLVLASFATDGFCAVRFGQGTKTVTTAGTAVALTATSTDATTLVVCGDSGNTGKIVVGAAPVGTAGAQQGIVLNPGSCASIAVDPSKIDISTVKVDSTVNGEEASYFWMNSNA